MAHKPNTTLVTAGRDRGVSFDFVNPLPCAGPLVRISAGLEDATDLIDDLQEGFERMRAYGTSGAWRN